MLFNNHSKGFKYLFKVVLIFIKMIQELDLPRKIKFLLQLSYKVDSSPISFSDLERIFGFKTGQPDFRQILRFLLVENIIVYYDTRFGIKRYRIDIEKLKRVIENSLFYKEFAEYIHNNKLIYANI